MMITECADGQQTLKEARCRKGYSIRELAAICGVSAAHISLIESGKRKPSAKMIALLGGALNMDSALPARGTRL
jgi:transcriptional regulator with XRE-family HTH domain